MYVNFDGRVAARLGNYDHDSAGIYTIYNGDLDILVNC